MFEIVFAGHVDRGIFALRSCLLFDRGQKITCQTNFSSDRSKYSKNSLVRTCIFQYPEQVLKKM